MDIFDRPVGPYSTHMASKRNGDAYLTATVKPSKARTEILGSNTPYSMMVVFTSSLIRVAFEIEKADRLEIMCEPGNAPSAAIPARLGFTHDATLPKRSTNSEGKTCDLMVWSLFAEDYPATPAAQTKMQATIVWATRFSI